MRTLLRGVSAGIVLLAGGLLYFARPADPAAIHWLDRLGFASLATTTRAARRFVHASIDLPAWFRGAASDAAFAFALGAILADAPPLVVALGALVVLGHEIGQGLGVFQGTFDPIDLAVLIAFFVFAQVVFRPRRRALSPEELRHDTQDLDAARRDPALRRARARQLVAEEG